MDRIIDQYLLDDLHSDPEGAFKAAFNRLDQYIDHDTGGWTADEYAVLLEGLAFLESLVEGGLVEYLAIAPSLSGKPEDDCRPIYDYLSKANERFKASQSISDYHNLKSRLAQTIGTGFFYEFSDGDLEKIQELVNDLRHHITKSEDFDPKHKQRLLRRLESIQKEIHKKVSDLDRFWGLVGDAGVVLGKFGENAKPIVDRIKEIAEIVWRTQARAEELPSGSSFPLLATSSRESRKPE